MSKLLKIIFLFIYVACFNIVQAQNYTEELVPKYTLPELLKTAAGSQVTTTTLWEKVRRPEVLRLFEDNVYGKMPRDIDSIKYNLVNQQNNAMNGKAILKEIVIKAYRNQQSVEIHLTLFIPAHNKGRVPVFVLINNRDKSNTDPTRITKTEFWPAEKVIESGCAVAAFHVSDLAPDNKDTYADGVLRLYPEQLKIANGMKAIGAWAWGAGRVMDYLQTDKNIDGKKVAIVGHSRGGKAALWAMAQDQRFAVCFANCSGNTGAALSRRQFGERIKRINQNYPYWFCDNYKQYNDREDALPIDQHMLIALSAPRAVYTTNATKDLWADPRGSYLSMKAAEPIYKLYGYQSKIPAEPPVVGIQAGQWPFGYHIREGIHDLTAFDWVNFVKFALDHYHSK